MFSKKIYMTYKNQVPEKVFNRWQNLNPDYEIDFSLDDDCINFLKCNFNEYIVNLFKSIKRGMFKADLWRLCKIYMNGGVYADVDLVPYLSIDSLDKNISFYSCLNIDSDCVFQAFMINFSKPKNPLIFVFLLSFLANNPYLHANGPCHDMFNCIKYNLNNIDIIPEQKYELDEVKIKINIGSSYTNVKNINLFYFPEDIQYTIKLIPNPHKDTFDFTINNNTLIVKRLDLDAGWGYPHSVDICIKSKESILLFKENIGPNNNWVTSYVTYNSQKILDSRDLDYHNNKGWITNTTM